MGSISSQAGVRVRVIKSGSSYLLRPDSLGEGDAALAVGVGPCFGERGRALVDGGDGGVAHGDALSRLPDRQHIGPRAGEHWWA